MDLQCKRSSSLETFAPSLSSTNAQGVSPHFSSCLATTPTATTSGCLYKASSTSIDEMFSPPDIIMSFDLSFNCIYPSLCQTPKSPV